MTRARRHTYIVFNSGVYATALVAASELWFLGTMTQQGETWEMYFVVLAFCFAWQRATKYLPEDPRGCAEHGVCCEHHPLRSPSL